MQAGLQRTYKPPFKPLDGRFCQHPPYRGKHAKSITPQFSTEFHSSLETNNKKMTTKTAKTWQEELAAECRTRGLTAPVFNIVSDRRGGRTAWSATVTVSSQNIAARYWYDGQYLNNAKEDAAEVACTRLRNPSITAPQTPSRGPSGSNNGSGWSR